MTNMKTDNNYEPYGNAGTNQTIEDDDLAPELSIKQAARLTRKFIENLPDNITDIDLGAGL